MAIKSYGSDTEVKRDVRRNAVLPDGTEKQVTDVYYRTQFIADTETDITAMNAEGSEYLNFPAGSFALCLENGEVYVMNAAQNAFVAKGGSENG